MAKSIQRPVGKPVRRVSAAATVLAFTVAACVSQRQPPSLSEDFEFLNVSDPRVVEYGCDGERVNLLELYERMRPRIEEALVEHDLGGVPEVIDLSKITLVGLHRHGDKKLVSYLLTEHWDPHEVISGEVGLAAVVQPCLRKVVDVALPHVSE